MAGADYATQGLRQGPFGIPNQTLRGRHEIISPFDHVEHL